MELKEIELGFLSGKSPSYYIVEISDDKESWNTICDNPQIEKADTTHRLVLDKGKNTGVLYVLNLQIGKKLSCQNC